MNKLEPGMYVRTKEGYICKILRLNEKNEDDGYLDHNDIGSASIQEKNVIKASFNIIDLIEVGDYINGIYVTQETINNFKYLAKEIVNNNYGIKSIVTKEQFEKMEYKI